MEAFFIVKILSKKRGVFPFRDMVLVTNLAYN